MSLPYDLDEHLDNLDAAMFSGDAFIIEENIKQLEHYINRWQKQIDVNRKDLENELYESIIIFQSFKYTGGFSQKKNFAMVLCNDWKRRGGGRTTISDFNTNKKYAQDDAIRWYKKLGWPITDVDRDISKDDNIRE